MIMSINAVEVKLAEPVATIVLNRPERCNALSRAMIEDLREALRDLYLEKRVRAIVLTGAGDAFCGGRDIREMLAEPDADPASSQQRWGEEASEYRDLILEMLELPKPIIASVNGAAAACGAGLALAADVVVASPDARFGLPDARRGVVAGVVTPLLAYRLGAGLAGRLLLTSEMIDASEAHRLGVFHEIAPHDLLWARSAELGKQCALAAPEAIGLTKRLLLDTVGEQLATQLTSGAIATATARTTEAAQEGLSAFVERREPGWR